jgi:hypothetical protein
VHTQHTEPWLDFCSLYDLVRRKYQLAYACYADPGLHPCRSIDHEGMEKRAMLLVCITLNLATREKDMNSSSTEPDILIAARALDLQPVSLPLHRY